MEPMKTRPAITTPCNSFVGIEDDDGNFVTCQKERKTTDFTQRNFEIGL